MASCMTNGWLTVGQNGAAMLSSRMPYQDESQWRKLCRRTLQTPEAECYRLAGEVCTDAGKVPYAEDLVSVAGMAFTLFRLPKTPRRAIVSAKKALRNSRDVVYIYQVTVRRLVYAADVEKAAERQIKNTTKRFEQILRQLSLTAAQEIGSPAVTPEIVQDCLPAAARAIMRQ